MLAVIFEVCPRDGSRQEYFDIASDLRPLLDGVDGFIAIERFESLSQPGKVLSLSFWRDEQAIEAWRRLEPHQIAQARGRALLFEEYRLRISSDPQTIRILRQPFRADMNGSNGTCNWNQGQNSWAS